MENNIQHRVGIGYDVHRLVEGRKLVIGGVEIPYSKGLLGHSDADVLVHAIMDALLGAAGLRDIGVYFPDSDIRYKNISSLLLLKEVKKIITETYTRVKEIIVKKKDKLDILAKLLLEKEVIEGDELRKIINSN